MLSNIRSIYSLYKIIKHESPDIVHVHTPIASILARIAARFAKVPVIIYTAHGFYFHDNMPWLKYKLFLNIEKFITKYFTDFIFTQSAEDASIAIKNNFINRKSILCIGNGVDVVGRFNPKNIDPEQVKRLSEEFDITEQNIVITFIGRLVSEKGVVELLEAFSGISYDNVRLLIVGDIDQGCRDQNTKNTILNKY
jgi:glycosyltransferase involved in cell wall biosynthesis